MLGLVRTAVGVAALTTWSAHALAEEPAKGTALVGFESRGNLARLESNLRPVSEPSEMSDWHTVCVAPCTRRLSVTTTFRAAGDGFEPSEPFVLPRDENRVFVTSTVRRKSLALPIAMIAVGFTSMVLIGPLVLVSGSAQASDGLAVAGLGVTLGGAIAGTAGIVLLVMRAQDRKSFVTITNHSARLELPGGFGLEPSGLTF